jgi:hypothetical protein
MPPKGDHHVQTRHAKKAKEALVRLTLLADHLPLI